MVYTCQAVDWPPVDLACSLGTYCYDCCVTEIQWGAASSLLETLVIHYVFSLTLSLLSILYCVLSLILFLLTRICISLRAFRCRGACALSAARGTYPREGRQLHMDTLCLTC